MWAGLVDQPDPPPPFGMAEQSPVSGHGPSVPTSPSDCALCRPGPPRHPLRRQTSSSKGLLKTLSVGALRDVSKRLNFPVAGMKKDQLLERLEDGIAGAMRAREETVVTPLRSGAPSDMVEGEDGDDGLQAAAEAQAEGRPVRGRGREREAEAAEEVQCVGMKREREEEGEGEGDCVKRLRGMSPERPEGVFLCGCLRQRVCARVCVCGLCARRRVRVCVCVCVCVCVWRPGEEHSACKALHCALCFLRQTERRLGLLCSC